MPAGIPVCKPIWDEFANDKEKLFCEAQRIKADLLNKTIEETLNITEKELEEKFESGEYAYTNRQDKIPGLKLQGGRSYVRKS